VDFKNNVLPRAVSEHKFFSLCELGVPKRADVARLGWEQARGTLCFPALQRKVPHPYSGADLPIYAK
jgi:hypothetical protein